MSDSDGGGGGQQAKPKSKKVSIEKIYQKKTQLEHILLRPDTYIGKIFALLFLSILIFLL